MTGRCAVGNLLTMTSDTDRINREIRHLRRRIRVRIAVRRVGALLFPQRRHERRTEFQAARRVDVGLETRGHAATR